MSYTKIYYDEIWQVAYESNKKCEKWLPELKSLSKSFNAFTESDSFKGEAATNMKSYLEQMHGVLLAIINMVIQSYQILAIDYYGGYTRVVDPGDGDEFGLRYTTIVNGEVSESGSVQKKLDKLVKMAQQVETDANSVKKSISDLVAIASSPKFNQFFEAVSYAKLQAQSVHNAAIKHEASRANDFDELDRLIAEANKIISSQLGSKSRVPVIKYQSGHIGNICDINQIMLDLEASGEKINAIVENEDFQDDANLVVSRDDVIAAEEKDSRKWVKWVAVGAAVVGAIVLTVATAGTMGPVGCALVGAAVGGVTAAVEGIADNYYENGTWFKGLDIKEFGKKVVVGAVGGAVTGYLGAVSQGSKITQPIKKGLRALSNTVLKEGAEGAAAITWEIGETACEVGEAIIDKKPGDEIVSVLKDGAGEIGTEVVNAAKDITVEGAKSFVGGTISGKFDVDTSDKSIGQKMFENAAEGVGESVAGGVVNVGWAVIDGDSSTTVESALKDTVKDVASSVTTSVTTTAVGEGIDGLSDKMGLDDIENKAGKTIAGVTKDTIKDTTEKTVESVTEGVTNRSLDYVFGDEKDASNILGDIWEKDLGEGTVIGKAAGESLVEHIGDEVYEEEKHYKELNKLDYDRDGKVDVVQFGDITVTKQDYDAAVENAGKGAYKDKTAQEILGLSRDTDIDSGKHREIDTARLEKYSYDRKTTDTVTINDQYTYKKDYYDAAINVAGSDEYGGKTANELLGIPDDVDLSDAKITEKRIRNEDIGPNEKVELHQDSGTVVTHLHITDEKTDVKFRKPIKETKKSTKK